MNIIRRKCDENISLTPSPTEEKQGQGGPDSGPEEGGEGQEGAVEDDGHMMMLGVRPEMANTSNIELHEQ